MMSPDAIYGLPMAAVSASVAAAGTRLRHWPRLLLLAAVSLLLCWGGVALTGGSSHIAAIWLANGVLLSALLLEPRRNWTAYIAVGFAANVTGNLLAGDSWQFSVVLGACNLLEVLVAAFPLRRLLGVRPDLSRYRAMAWFLLWAAILAPAVSALTAGALLQTFTDAPILHTASLWFPADSLGMALMAPATILLAQADLGRLVPRSRLLQASGSALLLMLVCISAFAQNHYPLLFLIFPPLSLVVFTLGLPGAAFGILLVAAISIGFTLADSGPLMLIGGESLHERIFMLQVYLVVAFAGSYPLALLLAEKKRLAERLEASEARYRSLAELDELTGLANRRRFDEALNTGWRLAARSGAPLTLLMIDVDWFKPYNDRYGHAAGDERLREVAAVLRLSMLRPGDLVCRYGGEEFAAILPNTDAEGGRRVAARIRDAVAALKREHVGSPLGRLSVSIGMAVGVPRPGDTAQTLFENADQALYQAKGCGRDRIIAAAESLAA